MSSSGVARLIAAANIKMWTKRSEHAAGLLSATGHVLQDAQARQAEIEAKVVPPSRCRQVSNVTLMSPHRSVLGNHW